jgi:ATP-dependent protease ClpP protease subunit
MDNYKKLVGIMKDYIIDRTNIDAKLYAKQSKKDWYITADECIQLGIATKIITNLDEII